MCTIFFVSKKIKKTVCSYATEQTVFSRFRGFFIRLVRRAILWSVANLT